MSNVRIIDIAKMAGVSSGTVDRVLHNRGKVSAEKREKIERVLREINYEPNIMARNLALKRDYIIWILIPSIESGNYWDTLNNGISKAARELTDFKIVIKYLFFDQYDLLSFENQMNILLESQCNAVLIASLFKESVVKLSKILDEKGIPYVYVDSFIPDQDNLAYFGINSFDSGMVAAKLMMYDIGKEADIFIANIRTNNKKDLVQTYFREQGFRYYLSQNGFSGKIFEVEVLDNYHRISRELNDLIRKNGKLHGGIVFNSYIYELVDILFNEMTLLHNIKLIGYDAIKNNIEALRKGKISFLLSQRSDIQGYNGVRFLSDFLLFGKKGSKTNYMPIDILIKENVEYYNNL